MSIVCINTHNYIPNSGIVNFFFEIQRKKEGGSEKKTIHSLSYPLNILSLGGLVSSVPLSCH